MVKSKRLLPVKKVAQNNEKQAAIALGQAINDHQQQAEKLIQLEAYRTDYLQQMQKFTEQGITGYSLRRYQEFIRKLDLAIAQQKEMLQRCSDAISRRQGHWKHTHGRHRAISQVIDKRAIDERIIRDKKEDRQNDELATQNFLRDEAGLKNC